MACPTNFFNRFRWLPIQYFYDCWAHSLHHKSTRQCKICVLNCDRVWCVLRDLKSVDKTEAIWMLYHKGTFTPTLTVEQVPTLLHGTHKFIHWARWQELTSSLKRYRWLCLSWTHLRGVKGLLWQGRLRRGQRTESPIIAWGVRIAES